LTSLDFFVTLHPLLLNRIVNAQRGWVLCAPLVLTCRRLRASGGFRQNG
jgi:hypothetical protein